MEQRLFAERWLELFTEVLYIRRSGPLVPNFADPCKIRYRQTQEKRVLAV